MAGWVRGTHWQHGRLTAARQLSSAHLLRYGSPGAAPSSLSWQSLADLQVKVLNVRPVCLTAGSEARAGCVEGEPMEHSLLQESSFAALAHTTKTRRVIVRRRAGTSTAGPPGAQWEQRPVWRGTTLTKTSARRGER